MLQQYLIVLLNFLFTDLAGKLIAKEIREGQGFYDVSKKLSKNDESIISVSIILNNHHRMICHPFW